MHGWESEIFAEMQPSASKHLMLIERRITMNMKEHILAALREQFKRWEELLAGMSETQITTPHSPSEWSTKDEISHLWAWQQRSIARLAAATLDREPDYPKWPAELDPNSADVDKLNAWIHETTRKNPWSKVHLDWKIGFLRFLELGEKISEKDLLDAGKYPWMKGSPLAFSLLSSYDHHQEHYDGSVAWLDQNGK
jgi:hypothetical protein